jgi:hypothetical protein
MGCFSCSRLVVFTLGGGVAALVVASAMPIWTLWHINELEGLGYRVSLWRVGLEATQSWIESFDGNPALVRTGDPEDFIIAGVAFGVGAAIGMILLLAQSHSRDRGTGEQLRDRWLVK